MNFRDYLKNNWLMLWYNLTVVYTFSFLLYDTFSTIQTLLLSFLFIIFHMFARYTKITLLRYLYAVLSLASLISALLIAHPPYANLTHYIYNIPLIYALLLNDLVSTMIVGVAINYIWFEYIPEEGLAVARTTSVSMIIASLSYTVIAHLFRNLTEEKNRYYKLSITDSLTGLATFDNSIEVGNEMLKQGDHLTVFEIDLDYFKQVNDNYGHLVGNQFLIYVADILKEEMNEFDSIVGRLGGDEFIIIAKDYPQHLLPNLEKRLMARLLRKIEMTDPDLLNVKIGFSIGYADGNSTKIDQVQDLLSVADVNMYHNKFHKKMEAANKLGIINLPDATIRFIHLMMEKDLYTFTHSRKTAEYATILAQLLQLNRDSIIDLYLAGWLHDIGKLYVPIYLLRKPDSLNQDEFSIMQGHVKDGLQIISNLNLSNSVIDAIKYHHEDWNGNGYPFQLSGEQIPLEARILHLVDAYSAMTLKHFYKNALTKEEAIVELEVNSGTQFDPELVDIFLSYLKKESR